MAIIGPADEVPEVLGGAGAPPRPRDRWDELGSPRPVSAVAPRRPRVVKPLRRPVVALPALVVLALLAAFFAWVSAGPFWLSLGHQVTGTMTVSRCDPTGVVRQCEGRFQPADGTGATGGVRVTGDTSRVRAGASVVARAVPGEPATAYVGGEAGLFLRWILGLALVLACGFAGAAVTGAWRWQGPERVATVLACLAGPVLLWISALAGTW